MSSKTYTSNISSLHVPYSLVAIKWSETAFIYHWILIEYKNSCRVAYPPKHQSESLQGYTCNNSFIFDRHFKFRPGHTADLLSILHQKGEKIPMTRKGIVYHYGSAQLAEENVDIVHFCKPRIHYNLYISTFLKSCNISAGFVIRKWTWRDT